jgi:hypothetical protein
MTLRVYTDVTGQRPRTCMAGLLSSAPWASAPEEFGLDISDTVDRQAAASKGR